MKSKLLVLALATAVFAGCKKDDSAPAINGNIKIETVKIISSGGSVDISHTERTYNGNNQVLTETDTDAAGNPTGKDVYEYAGNTVTVTHYLADLVTEGYQYVYHLNSKGLVESQDGASVTYTYDADGHLVNKTDIGVVDYTYYQGNLISIEAKDNTGIVTAFYSFNYTDVADYRNNGQTIFGKGSKNVIANRSDNNGNLVVPVYEYDSKGRVTKQTYAIGGNIFITSYTYFD